MCLDMCKAWGQSGLRGVCTHFPTRSPPSTRSSLEPKKLNPKAPKAIHADPFHWDFLSVLLVVKNFPPQRFEDSCVPQLARGLGYRVYLQN